MLKHINTIWFVIVAIILSLILIFPEGLTRESISALLNQMGTLALVVYLLVSLSRSLLLIPCTPFVLAGAISFPQWPLAVFVISMAGIVVGALLVYSFPALGSYDELLEKKYPEKIAVLKGKMHSKYAFWFVAGWAFFPLVPTDAICYVAGMAKLSFKKMVAAVVLGEIPWVVSFVFLGAEIGEWLRI